MKTLLTVDFDFFVPEKPEWDFGHQESLIFLNMIWSTRSGLMNVMKTDGNEVGFWKDINFTPSNRTWISDSHAYAYSLLNGVNRVVLFDAHHDCWYADSLGVDKTDHSVYCHNWLREWLRGGKNRRVTWVKPQWQDACELPKDMKKKVDVVIYSKGLDLGLGGSIIHHICRSGCWVPPWLDKAFLGFVEGLRGSLDMTIPMQEGVWNPLKERWTEQDVANYLKLEAEIQVKMKEMRIGTINSSDFLNCKVEQKVAI